MKDRDARWTVKFSKAKPKDSGEPQIDIAIPVFGYKSHVSVDRRQKATDASAHDGARLREGLIDPANTASNVWADTAYRSAANEAYAIRINWQWRICFKWPKGAAGPSNVEIVDEGWCGLNQTGLR